MSIIAIGELFGGGGLLVRQSELILYEAARVARPVFSGPMDPRDAD